MILMIIYVHFYLKKITYVSCTLNKENNEVLQSDITLIADVGSCEANTAPWNFTIPIYV